MKTKEKAWRIALVFLGCSMLFFSGVTVTCSQQKTQPAAQTVSLLPDQIKPATATITKGTTVVWVNEGHGRAEIKFTNAKVMAPSCNTPTNFVRNMDGQFISDKIPFAHVASLCFIQQGEFNYVVMRELSKAGSAKGVAKELKGKIIVK